MASLQLPRCVTALALALAALVCWPETARADEPSLAEARYDPTEYPPPGTRARLLLTGAGLTVGWYGVSLGSSFFWRNAPNAKDLRIPVAGPWIALGDVGCGPKEPECETAIVVFRTAVTVISGVGQLGGLLALWEGLWLDSGPPAAAGSARSRRGSAGDDRAASTGLKWSAAPVALPEGSLGLGVIGQF